MVTPFDQVPAAVERVQRELVLARFLGKIAVDQGLAELRSRIESAIFPSMPGENPTADDRVGADSTSSDPSPAQGDEPAGSPPDAIEADELALSDYDHLPASDIVAKLGGLELEELDAIERYESANRQRRTVLGKIRQLRPS
jgi:hypothetical protein